MLAFDFGEGVPQRIQKVVVGRDDGAVQFEFDHGLGLVNGVNPALQVHFLNLHGRDVGGELDHFDRLAGEI